MRIIFSLLFFSLSFISSAQEVKVSEDFSLRNDVIYEIIGKLKNQYLLYREQTTSFKIQAFDENMQKTWDKELELDKKRPVSLGIIPERDGFSLVYHFKQKGNTILKLHKYDPAGNLTDSIAIKDFGQQFYTPTFKMIYSDDHSKVLVYYVEQQADITALVFDIETLEIIWEKQFSPDKINFNRDFNQIVVSNEGEMFVIFEKDNTKIKQENHHFEIHHYTASNDNLRFFKIAMQGNLTYDIYFDYDNLNKHLVAGGLYSEKNRGRAVGFFYLNIPPENPDDHLLVFHTFQEEFAHTVMGKKKTKSEGISDSDIQEIVLRRDGGILLIGERNKIYERRTASNNGYTDRTGSPFIVDYHYDDVFVISIHPTGDIHWKNVLHKKQYSQDDNAIYSSYFLLKTPKNLRLLFNDEIGYENTVSEYVINGAGSLDRNSILSTDDQQLRLRFRDALQTSSNEIIVPSERRNRLKLVKVTY